MVTDGTTVTHIDAGSALRLAVIVGVVVVAVGLVVGHVRGIRVWRATRRKPLPEAVLQAQERPGDADDQSIVRAWLAVTLVAGLLLFGVVTFALDDTQLRSTLLGGLVASVASAVAFYFSSKTADVARKDLLGALFPTAVVPLVEGLAVADARATAAAAGLTLAVHPPVPEGIVQPGQLPPAGTPARRGEAVHVDVRPTSP